LVFGAWPPTPKPQSPIPNPQSPIPNELKILFILIKRKTNNLLIHNFKNSK